MDIGGQMKVNKDFNSIKIFFYLIIFIIILHGFYVEGNSLSKDPILNYILNELVAYDGCDRDYRLSKLSQFYIKFGNFEDAIRILDLISDEYHKYSIICESLDNNMKLSDPEFIKLEMLVQGIKDKELKFDISCKLILVYLERNNNEKAFYNLRIIKDDLDNEIKSSSFYLLINLIYALKENGLNEEADELLKEYEDFAFSRNGDFLSKLNVLEEYFNLRRYKKAQEVLRKIEKEINAAKNNIDKADRSIKLSKLMFEIEYFKKADEFVNKSLCYCKKIVNESSKVKCFIRLLRSSESIFLYGSLSNIDNVEGILIKNIEFDDCNRNNSSISNIYNEEIIKFFIRKGNFLKAREIALKLDNVNKEKESHDCFSYLDYYHYYLGKKYLESKDMKLKALSLAERIQFTPLKKLELLLEIAEFYFEENYEEKFFEILNRATQISIKDRWKKDDSLGNIAMVYLKAGVIYKALKLAEEVSYLGTKSALIYEVAQALINDCRIELAEKILKKYKLDVDFKAYLLSKIGAKLMIDGKEKESEEMFKKSINLILTTDTGSIEIILRDYLNAKKHKMIVRYNAWEKINVLD